MPSGLREVRCFLFVSARRDLEFSRWAQVHGIIRRFPGLQLVCFAQACLGSSSPSSSCMNPWNALLSSWVAFS